MKILLGCECSGIVRDAFIKLGHKAVSCDIKPTERPGPHLMCDVFDAINSTSWDAAIFFPDCTHLTGAQAWTFKRPDRFPDKSKQRKAAIKFAERLWACGIPKIGIENPVGFLSTMSKLGTPSQIIQPYNFGDDASKATCLWLKGFPVLVNTKYIQPRITKDGKKRWSNQTDSGQNRLPPSETRAADRARTYQGIANAMAKQWS